MFVSTEFDDGLRTSFKTVAFMMSNHFHVVTLFKVPIETIIIIGLIASSVAMRIFSRTAVYDDINKLYVMKQTLST